MPANNPKGIYPFIRAILRVMKGNTQFECAVHSDPMYTDVFVYGNMQFVPNVVRSMYVHAWGGEPTLAKLIGPTMFDPAFILQIVAQTGGDPEMGYRGKGNIWGWSGVQQHADFNGQIRPTISWK